MGEPEPGSCKIGRECSFGHYRGVYHAGSLWDGMEMGAPADVHCYTPGEFERKRLTLPRVARAVDHGIDLMAA